MKKEYNFDIPDNVRKVLDALEERGFPAYIVGGKLRDLLLNRKSNDFDLTTSASPNEIREIFKDKPQILSGMKHGTVSVICDHEPIEITTFRKDGEYSDSRHPDKVEFTSDISEDLARRDFTVNAMAYRCKDGKITDIYGGKTDIDNRIIRCVGDPEKRFSEDALRIMRGFRFCSTLDFDIEENTLKWAKKLSYKLENIAKERIGSEFVKLLEGQNPSKSLSLMGDVLDFVLKTDEISEERLRKVGMLPPDFKVRLGYILYGKDTQTVRNCANALRLSNKSKDEILLLSQKDETMSKAVAENQLSLPNARRILIKYGDFAEDFLKIACLDAKSDSEKYLCEILQRAKRKANCLSLAELRINGSDLVENGIAEGRNVGILLKKLFEAVVENQDLNEKNALLTLAKELSANIN